MTSDKFTSWNLQSWNSVALQLCFCSLQLEEQKVCPGTKLSGRCYHVTDDTCMACKIDIQDMLCSFCSREHYINPSGSQGEVSIYHNVGPAEQCIQGITLSLFSFDFNKCGEQCNFSILVSKKTCFSLIFFPLPFLRNNVNCTLCGLFLLLHNGEAFIQ